MHNTKGATEDVVSVNATKVGGKLMTRLGVSRIIELNSINWRPKLGGINRT
jgi:hypothetical protein